jgi:hypothetical protein
MKKEVRIEENTIYISYEGKLCVKPLNDILFCESCCHNSEIYVHTLKPLLTPKDAGTHELPLPKPAGLYYLDAVKPVIAPIGINSLALLLPGDLFARIHRKYIIYMGSLKDAYIEPDKILYGNYVLRISREYADEFLDKLKHFHFSSKTD